MGEYISILGIILSVILFVFLCYRKVNVVLVSLFGSIFISLMSGMNPFYAISETYMSGLGGFIVKYGLIFVMSALFGKVMDATGSARKIALSLASVTSRTRHCKYWTVFLLPVLYMVLSYVGVSGTAIIFTVIIIAKDMFKELDIPWALYPYGSAGIFPALILGGSAYSSNIIVTDGMGISLYDGMAFSVILFLAAIAGLMLLLFFDIKACEKRSEGFLPSGADIEKYGISLGDHPDPDSQNLPGIITAAVPLFTPLILILLLKANVVAALAAAITVCILLNIRRISDLITVLSQGAVMSYGPLITVSAAVGYAGVIKATSGFEMILRGLDNLPPLLSAVLLGMMTSAAVANSGSYISPIVSILSEKYAAAGISAATASRMALVSGCAYSMPHNSGIVNGLSLARLDYKRGVITYFKTTFIPGIAALAVGIVLISLKVFV
ncbi:MAG: hypothetical protein K5637_07075 [Lachnospiraceae bacterium]|nr:hypothetical protein [Lachnospiraceae bacterium]